MKLNGVALGLRHGRNVALAVSARDSHLVYLVCPQCGEQIKLPFVRTSGPIPFLHTRKHAPSCRLIVTPDPEGADHEVVTVPSDERIETLLEVRLRAWWQEIAAVA